MFIYRSISGDRFLWLGCLIRRSLEYGGIFSIPELDVGRMKISNGAALCRFSFLLRCRSIISKILWMEIVIFYDVRESLKNILYTYFQDRPTSVRVMSPHILF